MKPITMEIATEFFSLVCGQLRPFVVDGEALPVCQRCLGLYLGSLLTGLWLIGRGLWRRGLPGRVVIYVNSAILLTAMLGGLQAIDLGPQWRLACGLWTGHVATLWLAGATRQLWALSRPGLHRELAWLKQDRLQALMMPVTLAALALIFPTLLPLGWIFWTILASLGLLVLALAMLTTLIAACSWGGAALRQRT